MFQTKRTHREGEQKDIAQGKKRRGEEKRREKKRREREKFFQSCCFLAVSRSIFSRKSVCTLSDSKRPRFVPGSAVPPRGFSWSVSRVFFLLRLVWVSLCFGGIEALGFQF